MSKGWSADEMSDQSGRTAVVTGGNSGIGLAAARDLARRGAKVVIACRRLEKGEAAISQIRSELGTAGNEAMLDLRQLDLADLASVRAFSGLSAEFAPD